MHLVIGPWPRHFPSSSAAPCQFGFPALASSGQQYPEFASPIADCGLTAQQPSLDRDGIGPRGQDGSKQLIIFGSPWRARNKRASSHFFALSPSSTRRRSDRAGLNGASVERTLDAISVCPLAAEFHSLADGAWHTKRAEQMPLDCPGNSLARHSQQVAMALLARLRMRTLQKPPVPELSSFCPTAETRE